MVCQALNQLHWQYMIQPQLDYVLTDVKPTTMNPVCTLFSCSGSGSGTGSGRGTVVVVLVVVLW